MCLPRQGCGRSGIAPSFRASGGGNLIPFGLSRSVAMCAISGFISRALVSQSKKPPLSSVGIAPTAAPRPSVLLSLVAVITPTNNFFEVEAEAKARLPKQRAKAASSNRGPSANFSAKKSDKVILLDVSLFLD